MKRAALSAYGMPRKEGGALRKRHVAGRCRLRRLAAARGRSA
jgi:hypothetical protein